MTRPLRTILGQEWRLMLVDPFPFMLLVVMPLALVPFFTGGLVGGPVTSVPGLAALFGFLGIAVIGFAFMRDHGWRTWDRLRASGVAPAVVVAGKALPLLALFVAQQVIILLVGWGLLGMPWKGTLTAGALMILVTALTQVSLGLLAVVHAANIHHFNVVVQAGSLVAAGFGGALAPLNLLPGWMQRVAPLSPVYWSLKGLRGVVALGWGVREAAGPLAILAGLAVGAFLLTLQRYRHDEAKTFYI